MNVQYAVQGGDIYVLEVNPRASRTVPFVAKAIGLPVAAIAARVMAGETLASFNLKTVEAEAHRGEGSRAALRALPRRGHDPRPRNALDRRSHGPGRPNFGRAFAKSQIGAGLKLPLTGTVFISVKDADKESRSRPARALIAHGFRDHRHARHRAASCRQRASTVKLVNKVLEGRPHIVDAMKNGEVAARLQHHRGRAGAGAIPSPSAARRCR